MKKGNEIIQSNELPIEQRPSRQAEEEGHDRRNYKNDEIYDCCGQNECVRIGAPHYFCHRIPTSPRIGSALLGKSQGRYRLYLF
ncbi:hypothetical protein D3C84_1135990 [compost metagenome]